MGYLDKNGTLTVKGKGELKEISVFSWLVKKIVVTKGITSIGNAAFSYDGEEATQIILPDSVHTLEWYCFGNCKNLKTIRIPPKVKLIPFAAFEDCHSLKSVKLPAGLKTIYGNAFNRCNSLEKIVIPDSVTHMDRHVFRDCPKLKTIVLPKNLKKANLSFDSCFALRKIKNRSSQPVRLNTASGHRVWRVNGKKTTVLKANETAKTRGTKYRISYDLCGGKVPGRLPKTRYYGEKTDIPRAEREGYEFIDWRSRKICGFGKDFLTTYAGDITLTAHFAKVKIDSRPGGIVKVGVDTDGTKWLGRRDNWYEFRFRPVDGGETRYSPRYYPGEAMQVVDKLEKGKEYICEVSYGYGVDNSSEDYYSSGKWFLPRRIYV